MTTLGERIEVRAFAWDCGELVLLDQRLLPGVVSHLRLRESGEVAAAIRDMAVRGGPAIGLVAAYGIVLAARSAELDGAGPEDWLRRVSEAADELLASRPTAVNLRWAVRRMLTRVHACGVHGSDDLLAEAEAIAREDVEANRRIGKYGGELLPLRAAVLTHCNAGALATGGYGTALGVLRWAWEHGRLEMVYATETRPLLQGARLTAWELAQEGIPVTLLADGAAPWLLSSRNIAAVVVGADRIAVNGDVANKVGTYGLAVAAARHGVPFYVAAPLSTADVETDSGSKVTIEHRAPEEVTSFRGLVLAPEGVSAWNPAFDITPAELVTAIITEAGVIRPPYRQTIAAALGAADVPEEEG